MILLGTLAALLLASAANGNSVDLEYPSGDEPETTPAPEAPTVFKNFSLNVFGRYNMTLKTGLKEPASSVIWWKAGVYNDSQWAVAANVSMGYYNPLLHVQEASNLSLRVYPTSRSLTQGLWRATWTFSNGSLAEYVWNVTVWDSTPALVLKHLENNVDNVRLPQKRVSFVCVDLDKENVYDAYLNLGKRRAVKRSWTRLNQHKGSRPEAGSLFSLAGNTCPGFVTARCCSDTPAGTMCSKWSYLVFNNFLTTSATGWRQWCPKMNGTYDKHRPRSTLSSYEGTCDNSTRVDSALGTNSGCPGSNLTLQSWYENVTWDRWLVPGSKLWQRLPNDKHTPQYRYNLTFVNMTIWDTDMYRWMPLSSVGSDEYFKSTFYFSLHVMQRMRAVVALEQAQPVKIVLRCAHNAPDPVAPLSVRWDINSSVHHWQVEGDKLTIWPDCWHNLAWWHYVFAVRCTVKTRVWTATSDWATGDGWQESVGYNADFCRKHVYSRYYLSY